MHNRSVWGALAIAALVIAAAVAIGIGAYNAGMAQGLAQAGQAVAAAPPGAPPAFHFGFFPFFGLLFFFFVLRALFWGGRWGYRRGWGYGHQPPSPPPAGTTV